MALSRTALFYRQNPASRRHHVQYQAEINKKPSEVKKRVALNKYNRDAQKKGTAHVGDKMDASHKGKKIVGFSSQSRNRGDKNNSIGDKVARSPKYRAGGRKK